MSLYPETTKLSLAIILIKQLNILYVYVTTVVVMSAASEINHTIDITWEVNLSHLHWNRSYWFKLVTSVIQFKWFTSENQIKRVIHFQI